MSKILDQIIAEAKKYGVTVIDDGNEVLLDAPLGRCFEPGLHELVSSPWDLDQHVAVQRRALTRLREAGPLIEDCPADCECRDDTDE